MRSPGTQAAFEIIARDVFDNVLAFGRYAWAVSLSNDQNSFKVHQLAGSGTSGSPTSLAYNATRAGTYDLMVRRPTSAAASTARCRCKTRRSR